MLSNANDARAKLISDCVGSIHEAQIACLQMSVGSLVIQLPKEMVQDRLMMGNKPGPIRVPPDPWSHGTIASKDERVGKNS
jgi:hypothetical protein